MPNTKFPQGVQTTDVWDAADAVLMAGQRPTIERVRQKAGARLAQHRGPMLEAWFCPAGPAPGQHVGRWCWQCSRPLCHDHTWPAQPPATVLDLAQSLWDAALDQATKPPNSNGESAQAELAQQRSQLTVDRAELERERQTMAQQHSTLEQMLSLSRTQVADPTRRLADADAWRQEKNRSVPC